MKQLILITLLMLSHFLSFGQFVKGKKKISPISIDSLDYKDFERSISTNDAPINLNVGFNKFLNQHRKGNHIMIVGAVVSTVGCLFIGSTYHKDFTDNNFAPGIIMTSIGGGILATGWVINIDSFKHLR